MKIDARVIWDAAISYASRRVQEARADERSRCAFDAFESGYIQGHNDTVEHCVRNPKEAAEEYAAILQGTEPDESDDDRNERLSIKQELGAGCHDEMRYDAPAKVSEDVERDAEIAIAELRGLADKLKVQGYHATAFDMHKALDRLVSRLKEGNRG